MRFPTLAFVVCTIYFAISPAYSKSVGITPLGEGEDHAKPVDGTSAQPRQVGYAGFNPKTGIYAVYFPNYNSVPLFAAEGGSDIVGNAGYDGVIAGHDEYVPVYAPVEDFNRYPVPNVPVEPQINYVRPPAPRATQMTITGHYEFVTDAPVYSPIESDLNRNLY